MTGSLPVVVFRHRDCWFGLEAGCVRSRSLSPPDGALLASSFASLLDGNPEDQPARQWLLLHGQQDWSLGIAGEAVLLELAASQIHPLPPLLVVRSAFQPLRALAFEANRLLLLLDPAALEALACAWVQAPGRSDFSPARPRNGPRQER